MTIVTMLMAATATALWLSAPGAMPASAQGAGGAFKDCADCPEMVVIPAGSFLMGSKPDPGSSFQPPANEQPQRQVKLKSFALGKYEVTQEQWKAVMDANPSFSEGGSLPVETVSWNDIQVFIQKLNAKTGKQYRLPTEAEWEYAARAGTTTRFSFGNDEAQLGTYAWLDKNSGDKTHPVGEKPANAFGLHDMHGNVWEWVQDCYKGDYVNAPTDGTAVLIGSTCGRAVRGGSFVSSPEAHRSAFRVFLFPVVRYLYLGFRLARSLP